MVWSLRKGFDLVSMYKHVPMPTEGTWTTAELRKRGSTMTPDQWLMVRPFHARDPFPPFPVLALVLMLEFCPS